MGTLTTPMSDLPRHPIPSHVTTLIRWRGRGHAHLRVCGRHIQSWGIGRRILDGLRRITEGAWYAVSWALNLASRANVMILISSVVLVSSGMRAGGTKLVSLVVGGRRPGSSMK